VDLLCAGMSMGAWSRDTFSKTEGCKVAHFFGAIRTDLFGNAAQIADHVESILREVRKSAKSKDHDRIYIHGEKEIEAKAVSMVEGVQVDEDEWNMLDSYAEKFGLEKVKACK
jgi:L-2-hydroxycarboxylate dehydrogenase (NAD+)